LNRQALVDELERGFQEWRAVIAEVPAERLAEPGVSGEWSVKDIVAHVAFSEWWLAEFIRARAWPAVPDAMNVADADERNAAYFALRRHDAAEVILDEAARWHNELVEAIVAASDAEIADTALLGMPPGDRWRFDSLVQGAGVRHYPEHIAAIRAWLARTSPRR
jgi:hypothetical protein